MSKNLFKVVILGDSGVGKTSLINRYVYNSFSQRYMATIGSDFHAKDMVVEGKSLVLQIWDTAGQERFQSLGVAYYRGSDACVLVFDVTVEATFLNLQNWMSEFLIQAQPADVDNFPIVVIGNKVDCQPSERVVSTKRAQDWCAKNRGLPYYECSAQDGTNVERAFTTSATLVLQNQTQDPALYNPGGIERPAVTLNKTAQQQNKGKGGCC
eukprot:TRINITY_DN116003_c0_g1_i1.p1 TRINITY_DN116003_c0_g1~~TRINITY_DN116003_c0_g1_i1.p1  ORF type:complete len:211 (-),score=4.75 TRINITY_DN116003_c0_g1_i1:278-910(-)